MDGHREDPLKHIRDLERRLRRVEHTLHIQREIAERNKVLMFKAHDALSAEIEKHKRTEVELREAKQRAEAAGQAKGDFLAHMSHELRTPMNGVLGMLELALRCTADAETREYIGTARASAEELLGLLDQLLDLSKIEAGRMDIEQAPFSPWDAADEAWAVFEPLASRKGLQIVLDFEGIPARVLGDVVRFRQVLRNLVSNAIKFTAQGEVRICLRYDGTRLLGEVSDTGIGIDPERLPALFTPFTQADRSTTRRFGGTGLGLSIARRLCEAMGGSLNASSQPGEGTTFSFELTAPVARHAFEAPLAGTRVEVVDDRHTSMALATLGCTLVDRHGDPEVVLAHTAVCTTAPLVRIGTEPIAGECARLGAPVRRIAALHTLLRVLGRDDVTIQTPAMLDESATRILVADDNPVNQRIVRKAIELAGRRCDVVDDGEAAVRAARTGRYDLIFMDCQMPQLDGYDATRAIRSLSTLRQPHIVALTAYAHESDRVRCAEAGMDEYASKPVSIDLIGQIVRRVFG